MSDYNRTARKNTSSSISLGVGGTLIIVIFVVLCLTVFATLSFTAAYADLKLSNKTAQITEDYYNTHALAEEKLSEVYAGLIAANEQSKSGAGGNFNELAKANIAALEGVSITENPDSEASFSVSYEALGAINQKICVNLDIFYDADQAKPYYSITSWNLSNITLPNYEETTINLWKGTE